ncbi:HNH endonuclease [Gordonia sp. CPCC 205333]|uniref:HNH endonuclease n=1 Tax=Gordonia sp. CPCC 205333 TaxID=3140790 RepID=UPI003AF3F3D5
MAWTGDPRTSTPGWRRTRANRIALDNNTCQHCGHHSPNGVGLQVDHLHTNTWRADGTDDLNALQTLCEPCHKAKTNRETAARNRARAARRRLPTQPHPGLQPDGGG